MARDPETPRDDVDGSVDVAGGDDAGPVEVGVDELPVAADEVAGGADVDEHADEVARRSPRTRWWRRTRRRAGATGGGAPPPEGHALPEDGVTASDVVAEGHDEGVEDDVDHVEGDGDGGDVGSDEDVLLDAPSDEDDVLRGAPTDDDVLLDARGDEGEHDDEPWEEDEYDDEPSDDELASEGDPDAATRPVRRRRSDRGGRRRARRRRPARARRGDAGPRAVARREARRRRVRTIVLTLVGLAFVGVGIVVAGPLVVAAVQDDGTTGPSPAPSAAAPATVAPSDADAAAAVDTDPTVLLTTIDPTGAEGERATGAVVLGVDEETGRGTILLVPVTLAAEVPGSGLLQLAAAQEVGQDGLVGLTLQNLLRLDIDATATVARQDWAALFARVGGFEVTVREPLTGAAGREVRFQPGAQFLDGPRLAELLTLQQPDEAELASLPRAQAVLEGFLATAGGDGLDAVFEDGAPMLRASDDAVLEATLRRLAALARDDLVDTRILPVTPIGAGEDASYRVDEDAAEALVAARFPRVAADAVGGDGSGQQQGLRLEILNGVGTPGLGAVVADRLVPLGHRVVLTGNAEEFDVRRTLVVVHSDAPEVVRAAQEMVDALGAGRVRRATVPQGTADVTVLVGSDFAP